MGRIRHGAARRGLARSGGVSQVWRGPARRGEAGYRRQGKARRGWAGHGTAGKAGQGQSRRGLAGYRRRGAARRGLARLGTAGQARLGGAGPGLAGQGRIGTNGAAFRPFTFSLNSNDLHLLIPHRHPRQRCRCSNRWPRAGQDLRSTRRTHSPSRCRSRSTRRRPVASCFRVE